MRTANMVGRFHVEGNQLKGKRVLVVDDVVTTGATLSAATQCLLEIGATVVYAAVLARTDAVANYAGKR
jgi:predicted amidophosphoribosyltransferase